MTADIIHVNWNEGNTGVYSCKWRPYCESPGLAHVQYVMGLYEKYVLPKAIDWVCKGSSTMKQRQKIVPCARGAVLEVGIGSGLNFPFYDRDQVRHLIGIDPSGEIWKEHTYNFNSLPFDFQFIQASAEDIPVDNHYFDTVLVTYTLCSIQELGQAFDELRRVMKSAGRLVFCEHGKAPDQRMEKWQKRLNPMWKLVSGGCNLNRDIPGIINGNGFQIKQMETMYIPGWKPASFNYLGIAKLR